MKIDGELVRALREEKSWSQEHLARASGLSERTIQRVEVEGVGSAETRLALAAALGVPVSQLMPPPAARPPGVAQRLPLWGWAAWAVGIACSLAIVIIIYRQTAIPLERITINSLPWLALLGVCAAVMATRAFRRRAAKS